MKLTQTHSRVFLLLLLAIAGCGSPDTGSAQQPARPVAVETSKERKPLRIGLMPKLIGIDYFDKAKIGAEEASKELGIDLTYGGPTEAKADLQAQMIDEWVAKGIQAIAVSPNDPFVIAPAFQRAKRRDVLMLTWDGDASPTGSQRRYFVNQASAAEIGSALVEIMAAGIGGEGKVVIVTGSNNSPNQNAWIREMRLVLQKKYPRLVLLDTLIPEEDQDRARRLTLEALVANPDLKGIWGITSVVLPGVAEAVKQSGKSGKIFVTGLGLPSTIRPHVKDGTISKFVLWNPVDLGYLTVHVAKAAFENSLKPGATDFGRLKGIRVLEDEVILGPPLIFDRSNIDTFNF